MNDPLSIAVPYKKGKPVALDIAMSKVAGGKVRLAAKNKQKIPQNWIIDIRGKKMMILMILLKVELCLLLENTKAMDWQ